jgi:subtilisin-like proprotein convertase family protein
VHPGGDHMTSDDRFATWALEVTDPAPRDLGELAEWAADVVDQGTTE